MKHIFYAAISASLLLLFTSSPMHAAQVDVVVEDVFGEQQTISMPKGSTSKQLLEQIAKQAGVLPSEIRHVFKVKDDMLVENLAKHPRPKEIIATDHPDRQFSLSRGFGGAKPSSEELTKCRQALENAQKTIRDLTAERDALQKELNDTLQGMAS
jgi:hypothetical protein